ncbi:hypothetical protein [Gottfriedia solisilvae]
MKLKCLEKISLTPAMIAKEQQKKLKHAAEGLATLQIRNDSIFKIKKD